MKNIYRFLLLAMFLFLFGCAAKMAYLNTQKPPEEVKKDKTDCQAVIDASDFKDSDLKQSKFNQCMKDRGYNVVSEDEAEKIQGFKELWVKPGADFKAYEAIFMDKVDLSRVKIKNSKVTDEDINNLGEEMLKRFSKALSVIMPVILDKEEAAGKKILYLSLKLNNISQTDVGLSATLGIVGHFTPIPLPGARKAHFLLKE